MTPDLDLQNLGYRYKSESNMFVPNWLPTAKHSFCNIFSGLSPWLHSNRAVGMLMQQVFLPPITLHFFSIRKIAEYMKGW